MRRNEHDLEDGKGGRHQETHVSSLAKVGEGVGEVGDEEGEAEVGRRAVDEVEAVGERPEGDGEVHSRWVDGVAVEMSAWVSREQSVQNEVGLMDALERHDGGDTLNVSKELL